MTISEFKLKLENSIEGLVDTYFCGQNFGEKFINSTIKVIIKQNISKFDPLFEMFTDANGNIDQNFVLAEYANQVGDTGVRLDIRDYIDNNFIKSMIPNKVLLITKNDIMNLVN